MTDNRDVTIYIEYFADFRLMSIWSEAGRILDYMVDIFLDEPYELHI